MPTFTFQDIFKSSFLERLDAVSLPDAVIALALAFCLGLFIFLVYGNTAQKSRRDTARSDIIRPWINR